MEWVRSVTLIGIGFVGVVAATIGLAALIVPDRAVSPGPGSGGSPGPSGQAAHETPGGGILALGGSLTVTGDRQGTLVLTRESQESSYALVGADGRIAFEGAPVVVTQVSYDGLEFFPDADECTVTPGAFDGEIGIGRASLSCTDIADIRDHGVISIEGTIGLPVDRLVGRELPPSGGSIEVGPETWTFDFALLLLWQQPTIAGTTDANMTLQDEEQVAGLYFYYDIETLQTSVSAVSHDGETLDVPEGACDLASEELGRPNPRSTTIELDIDCPGVEVPGLGVVPIRGTLVVDELEFPF